MNSGTDFGLIGKYHVSNKIVPSLLKRGFYCIWIFPKPCRGYVWVIELFK